MRHVSAGIVGATGYAGAELVRLLLAHPRISLEAVVSRSRAGERLDAAADLLHEAVDIVVVGAALHDQAADQV